MKFTVNRADLVKELGFTCRIVPANPTLPILACVLLELEEDTLHLKTTNMDITLMGRVTVDVKDRAGGGVCVPARRFAKIVAEMADDVVTVSVDEKHEVTVKGATAVFKLLGISEDDFPVTAKTGGEPVRLQGAVLLDAIAPVLHAVSDDETRFVLNGIFLELDKAGEIHAVATDGRRLAACGGKLGKDAFGAVVPTAMAHIMATLAEADEAVVLIGKDNITVRAGEREAISKLIEGTYPNWKQVVPVGQPISISVGVEVFKAALKRGALVAGETVALTFAKNKLTISGSSADIGSGTETLPIEYTGAPVEIAFAPAYVIQALTACGEDAILGLTDGLSPMVVSANRFGGVVMPKRIS
jgi:DNA polymerase-3 subunit beta